LRTRLALLAAVALCSALPAAAAGDRTHYVRTIVIEVGETPDDVLCYFCSVRVRGKVSGDVIAVGGDVDVEGAVAGDVVAAGGAVRIHSGAKIAGDAVAVGGPVRRDPQSQVSEDVVSEPRFFLPGQRSLYLRGAALFAGIWLGLALVFYLLARKHRVERMADSLKKHLLRSILLGVAAVAVASLLYYASPWLKHRASWMDYAVTLVWLFVFAFGLPGTGLWLGRKVAPAASPFLAMLAGVALIIVVQGIPIVGILFFAAFLVLATGCALSGRFGSAHIQSRPGSV
jgi:hypothetical protein